MKTIEQNIFRQVTDIKITYDLDGYDSWCVLGIKYLHQGKEVKDNFSFHIEEMEKLISLFEDESIPSYTSIEKKITIQDNFFCLSPQAPENIVYKVKISDPILWHDYFDYHYHQMLSVLYDPQKEDHLIEYGALRLKKIKNSIEGVLLCVDDHEIVKHETPSKLASSLQKELNWTESLYVRFEQPEQSFALHKRVVLSAIKMIQNNTIPII